MQLRSWPHKARTIIFTLLGFAGAVGALWYALFALKPYDITPEQLAARYTHTTTTPAPAAVQLSAPQRITVSQTAAWASDFRMLSFDGAVANGRIVYPTDPAVLAAPRPVLLGMHAMGRSHGRWSEAEIKGKQTRENTHRLTEMALQQGYVVMALDAREHGDRKNADKPLTPRELLRNLHWWGEREPYERLIVDTVKDWRVLLDWVVQQPQFDRSELRAAGYSMGAQMALLLAGTDGRVSAVAAMVPPGLTNRVAVVAPLNVAPQLTATRVWLLTGDNDDHASVDENAALFAALPGAGKQHLRFAGGHLLPAEYVERLLPWLIGASRSSNATTPNAAPELRVRSQVLAVSSHFAGLDRKTSQRTAHVEQAVTRSVTGCRLTSQRHECGVPGRSGAALASLPLGQVRRTCRSPHHAVCHNPIPATGRFQGVQRSAARGRRSV